MALRTLKTLAAAGDRVRPPTPGVVVLIYHRVGGGSGTEVDLSPEAFDDQMAWLAATGRVAWGWVAWVVMNVSLGAGDVLLVGRSRHRTGRAGPFARDYLTAVRAVFGRELPGRVVFHALFSPVVYFSALAACIAATVG